MNQLNFKSVLPHIIAIVIFALVAIVYCQPALEGKVLQQSDVTQWKGMAQDALEYKAKYGTTPLWTNSMFGGMPTYQITGIPANAFTIGTLDLLFTLRLPEPIGLFFLASICFYILAQILGFNTIISVIGGLAYSYATYNPIIVTVGHMTKMHAIGYLPLFVGSILLLFKKRYLMGSVLVAISTALFVQANHLQITYYGIIIVFFLTLFYLVKWIKEKEYTHIGKTFAFGIVAGALGLAVNAPMLVSTFEYGKQSIRGGSALITKDSKTTATGLNKEYALSYSMFTSEPLVMMFPNLYGGASDPNVVEPTTSKAIEVLQQMQPQIAQQLQSFVSFYWGGIGITSGPPYIGIVICFFALMGISVQKNEHRYWMIPTIIFALFLAAGSYFLSFNSFMLEHLPFYNKFRAPSMIIIIPTLLLGVMALYGLDAMVTESNWKGVFKKYRYSFIILGLVFLAVIFIYSASDFKSDGDKHLITTIAQLTDPNQRAAFEAPANDLVNALVSDRKSLIEADLIKAFIFILITSALLFLAFKKIINHTIVLIAIGLVALFDLFQLNIKYLKPDHFVEQTENESAFTLTPLDNSLKKDTTNYRVLDMRYGINNAFNGGALIAYHHKTVGGYNPAKLSIYQDLIENQWYKFPNCIPTANMLNTKYIIYGNLATDTVPNKSACGNVWFVKGIRFEKDAASVMKALDNFNPKDTAIIEEKDKIPTLSNVGMDSSSQIKLIQNDNDIVTYSSSTQKNQFAVFSEIYYPLGWKAYIDDKETPIVKVNYVLRGLVVPAGSHQIKFELKPSSIVHAKQASNYASFIIWALLGYTGFYWFKKNKTAKV
jgi:hypothetical protein